MTDVTTNQLAPGVWHAKATWHDAPRFKTSFLSTGHTEAAALRNLVRLIVDKCAQDIRYPLPTRMKYRTDREGD